jgi:hypothetical protein
MARISTRTLLAALAAATAVSAVALPAAAQRYDYGYDGGRWASHDQGRRDHHRYDRDDYNINQRQERLDRRIDRGLRDGSLTRHEARELRDDFNRIAWLEARYRSNGLSYWERADLDRRFDRLEDRTRYERRDRDYGYGYGNYR